MLNLFSGTEGFEETTHVSTKTLNKERYELLKLITFGYEHCSSSIMSGKFGIPLLPKYVGKVPEKYTTIREIKKEHNPKCCVTGYNDDYILDMAAQTPEKYTAILRNYLCMTNLDFSLYVDSPLSVQIASCFRSHAIASYFIKNGIPILPSISWSTKASYEFCFDGYSKGGIVIVSSIGTHRNDFSRNCFKAGFLEMLNQISPDCVIIYCTNPNDTYSWIPTSLDVRYVTNERFKRARQYGR